MSRIEHINAKAYYFTYTVTVSALHYKRVQARIQFIYDYESNFSATRRKKEAPFLMMLRFEITTLVVRYKS